MTRIKELPFQSSPGVMEGLLDNHHSLHDRPVSGEGADEGILSGL